MKVLFDAVFFFHWHFLSQRYFTGCHAAIISINSSVTKSKNTYVFEVVIINENYVMAIKN